MKAIIKKKEPVAKGTVLTEFDLGEEVNFKPGQYFFVTLKPADQDHKDDLTHHFSIVNSPNQKKTLSFTTRIRPESLFKRTLESEGEGSEAEIGKIDGSFTLPDHTDKPIVLVALGIGITPYMSMLRYAMEENKPYDFCLIYCDDDTESMAYLDELKALEKDHVHLKLVVCATNDKKWEGESRHVDGDLLRDYLDDIENRLYYVSGPPKAVEAVAKNLKEAGIAEDNIKTDSFSGY
jgi:ferredoxin-NADP reductase